MNFRRRLVVFLFLTLAVMQASTAIFAYEFTRNKLIEQGKEQLIQAKNLFVRQLDEIGVQVASGVEVLALDFALRQAIGQHDQGTVLSALRNHGKRVGATRMLLVGLDGTVGADTGDTSAENTPFGFPALIEAAAENGRASSIVAIGGKALWMVVVPVRAPVPIAFIAAGVPVDDQLLQKIQGLAALPKTLALAADGGAGSWVKLAGNTAATRDATGLVRMLPPVPSPLSVEPENMTVDGHDEVVLVTPLATAPAAGRVVAVMGYPLAEVLRQYQPIILAPFIMLGGAALIGLAGALLIARSVARPVEALAAATRRIEQGDYTPPKPLTQKDELGELSVALGSMAQAISEREERIKHQATHDAVTGQLNRTALEEMMAGPLGHPPAALLLVGFSRLHETVKTVGREIADRLMRDAGHRLAQIAGTATLARVGDHTYGLFLRSCVAHEANELARRVVSSFEQPYREGDLTIDAAATIGIALAPNHGTDGALLLQRADVALFAAFRSESRIALYDLAADPHRPEQLSLMSDLRQALEQNGLLQFYQPKLDLSTGRVGGVEALVRWQHPKRGAVPPDAFISLAEETGNIQRLTRWALASSIAQAASWRARGLAMRMSVNLSVRDLSDAGLPVRIAALLDRYDLPASQLMLEVTESAIMGEPDTAIAVLRVLGEQGIGLSIDDFGVGQSSLSYLRRLPVRELKIDKSFVLNLGRSNEDRVIVQSVIELGHRLGYSVTAEGVEDETALARLNAYACDHAQGYHIAKPMPADEFDRFLDGARWPGQRLAAAS